MPDVALGTNGEIVVAGADQFNSEVYAARYAPGSGWNAPMTLANTASAISAKAGVNGAGQAVVAALGHAAQAAARRALVDRRARITVIATQGIVDGRAALVRHANVVGAWVAVVADLAGADLAGADLASANLRRYRAATTTASPSTAIETFRPQVLASMPV